jgi:hypothetical protein
MWIYFVGPFLALLPRRWRKAVFSRDMLPWRTFGILSGMAESLIALGALLFWYSYSVTTWVSKGLDYALSQNAPTGITDHEVGFAALVLWATHPLTWLLAYFGVEGMVRLCATFTDTTLGTFPLYVAEKIHAKITGYKPPVVLGAPKFERSHVSSYMDTVRDKVMIARLERVADELFASQDGSEERLEIRSWRAKPEWDPPRVVRYEDRYYRLEESRRGAAPRPFVYKLRRLPAGVPGRSVLVYAPEGVPVIANR